MKELLTTKTISEKTGFSRQHIDFILNRARAPSLAAAVKLEDATGVNRLAWLFPDEHENPYMRKKVVNDSD
jgi:transcriptional regulator with XRE-family HTH domain